MAAPKSRWVVYRAHAGSYNSGSADQSQCTFWLPVWYTTAPHITTEAAALAAYLVKFPQPRGVQLRAAQRPCITRSSSPTLQEQE